MARLGHEASIEPYAGLRADVRLFRTPMGILGIQASYDSYAFGVKSLVPPPCMGICATSTAAAEALLDYREAGSVHRLALGATWQRLLVPWVQLDAAVLTGVTQGRHLVRIGTSEIRDPAPMRPLLGAQLGVSTRYRAFLTGLAFEFTGDARAGSDARRQNRLAVRMGYVLH
jgi:hypothetical protein